MNTSLPVAIIGAGPAGALAAANLVYGGRRVLLFDEKLAWEKPCGGGLTHKALREWPFLRESGAPFNWVHSCELISPSGRSVSFELQQPIAIFSRAVLNGLLLERARQAGADVVHDRVVEVGRHGKGWRIRGTQGSFEAAYVVIAAGARNAFRKQLCGPFSPEDLMVTAGYYIPGHNQAMQVQFLPDVHGYIWIFPRTDHFSAGICAKMGGSTVELRRTLESHLDTLGLDFRRGQFYSHVLPALRAETFRQMPVCGDGWAMIGDAAGFVDPMTGEGLYYAMRSAEVFSQALLAGQPETYAVRLENDFLPELELGAQMSERFYAGRWMGQPVIERMVQFVANSASFRALMSDLFAGTQGYRDLRRRLYLTLPAMLAESLASVLRLPGSEYGSAGSRTA